MINSKEKKTNSFMCNRYIINKLKLLIIINGWSGKNIGGGDYHMLNVMKEWSNSHQISLVIPLFGFLFSKALLSDKYKIYLSSSGSKPIDCFRLIPTYSKRIIRAMLMQIRDKPDVVICSTHLLFDTLPGFILRNRFRAKFVVYVHHLISKQTDFRTGMLSRISILGERLSIPLIRRADILFVVNEKVRDELIDLGFEPGKILLSSNGVDYKAIDSIKRVEDDIIYDACFCGRLVKRKGIYDLVEIWKLVTVHYPKSKLVIVGDGPEYDYLSVKVKESNLEANIYLMGFVSENDKYLIMKKSRIFIFPSYEEGWGIAVAEAIASGLKVVLYDIGTYKIFEKNIIAVEKANIGKMSKIIIEMIGNQNSNDTREFELSRVSNVLDWQDVANSEIQSIRNSVYD
jgi:glycosyltransferase involved in cell wall biosynthesis